MPSSLKCVSIRCLELQAENQAENRCEGLAVVSQSWGNKTGGQDMAYQDSHGLEGDVEEQKTCTGFSLIFV